MDPSGLVAGVGKGFMRTVNVDPSLIGDLIPVDIPISKARDCFQLDFCKTIFIINKIYLKQI